jgi:hypothetical protein
LHIDFPIGKALDEDLAKVYAQVSSNFLKENTEMVILLFFEV